MKIDRERLIIYGTKIAPSSQVLPSPPSSYSLLKYRRQLIAAKEDMTCFSGAKRKIVERDDISDHYEAVTLGIISEALRENRHSSLRQVTRAIRASVIEMNEDQTEQGVHSPIPVLSASTCLRNIKDTLDQIWVDFVRFGNGEAKNQHSFNEGGIQALLPGDRLEIDTWIIHVITLGVSREKLRLMSAEERSKMPRVRRLAVIALVVAKRWFG